LVSIYTHSVNCPRPGCHRRLILPATTVISVGQNHFDRDKPDLDLHGDIEIVQKQGTRPMELRCGACYQHFFITNSTVLNSAVICPRCKARTSVGPDFARHRKLMFLGYAFASLTIALAITIPTYLCREQNDGVYSLQVGTGTFSWFVCLFALMPNLVNLIIQTVIV
uniref:Phosphatidylinositol-4,5-bisphosphate 4-phosphatase n=1 Tax=Echinostoma caproni TaxID=27848 RepID=A0A183B1X1_9TREM